MHRNPSAHQTDTSHEDRAPSAQSRPHRCVHHDRFILVLTTMGERISSQDRHETIPQNGDESIGKTPDKKIQPAGTFAHEPESMTALSANPWAFRYARNVFRRPAS